MAANSNIDEPAARTCVDEVKAGFIVPRATAPAAIERVRAAAVALFKFILGAGRREIRPIKLEFCL